MSTPKKTKLKVVKVIIGGFPKGPLNMVCLAPENELACKVLVKKLLDMDTTRKAHFGVLQMWCLGEQQPQDESKIIVPPTIVPPPASN